MIYGDGDGGGSSSDDQPVSWHCDDSIAVSITSFIHRE